MVSGLPVGCSLLRTPTLYGGRLSWASWSGRSIWAMPSWPDKSGDEKSVSKNVSKERAEYAAQHELIYIKDY